MTVLIADDNTLIRNWLKIMLNQLGGEKLHILEAIDGNEALSICLSQTVDLLITDIRMPGMDGVSLIKTLRTQCPDLQSAVLSSYDDFSYVRIALQCGALDYILKAEMQQEDISSLVQKAKERIALGHGSQAHLSRYTAAISAAVDAYSRFLQETGNSSTQLLSACQLDNTASGMVMTLMRVTEPTPGTGTRNAAPICCLSLQDAGLHGLAFPIDSDQILMLYSVPNEPTVSQREQHLRLLSTLEQSLATGKAGLLQQNVTLILSPQDDFPHKLRYLKSLMDYQIYYHCSALPEEEKLQQNTDQSNVLHKLQAILAIKDPDRASSLLQQYVIAAHRDHELPRKIRRTVTTITQMMLSALSQQEHISDEIIHLDRLAQEISSAKEVGFMYRRINEFCRDYQRLSCRKKALSPAISQALAYCSENFSHKVTLDEVASVVQLNKSYFSQLFHKEMGISFGAYLETLRIQNARQILCSSGVPMSDVAEKAGFSNQNYFTKVFKKVTGMTPSQYRAAQFQASGKTN